MAEPRFSLRSAKAREVAHRLARREGLTVADVVERALQFYEEAGHESASIFHARLAARSGADIDLQVIIDENRRPHEGVEL